MGVIHNKCMVCLWLSFSLQPLNPMVGHTSAPLPPNVLPYSGQLWRAYVETMVEWEAQLAPYLGAAWQTQVCC